MASYLKAGDVISGQEATARMTIKNPDGTSQIEDLFFGRSLEATVTIEKADVRTLGKRGIQKKPNGWSGEGTLNVYYITSLYRRMVLQYIKTGIPVYFDMIVKNDDPGSTAGSQTTILKNCSVDSVIMAKFDVEADAMDEDIEFTFDGADILDEFVPPVFGNEMTP